MIIKIDNIDNYYNYDIYVSDDNEIRLIIFFNV